MSGTITKIKMDLIQTFNQLFDVFNTREDLLYYKPANEGWSLHEVLEHILLANHFLLRMVSKQKEQAVRTALGKAIPNGKRYVINKGIVDRMERTGSFMWVPQQYTEPVGEMPLLQLKMSLHDQLKTIIHFLQNRPAIDAIVQTSEPGKADALHYLYFLVQHIQRHLRQIERVKHEFNQWQKQLAYGEKVRMTGVICLN